MWTSTRKTIAVYILLAVWVTACRPPITIVTPEGRKAYTANEIVIRVNRLMDTAIQADATGNLPVATARVLIRFCVRADEVLQRVPNGWGATVWTLWQVVKADPLVAPYLTNQYIALVVSSLDIALIIFAQGGQ